MLEQNQLHHLYLHHHLCGDNAAGQFADQLLLLEMVSFSLTLALILFSYLRTWAPL